MEIVDAKIGCIDRLKLRCGVQQFLCLLPHHLHLLRWLSFRAHLLASIVTTRLQWLSRPTLLPFVNVYLVIYDSWMVSHVYDFLRVYHLQISWRFT